MSEVPLPLPRRLVEVEIDGATVRVAADVTIREACDATGIDVPTLCFGDTLEPANACRICVVEVEGARTLVPACSRRVDDGMVIRTGSERVRHSRKLVLELLGSSVDLSTTRRVGEWMVDYQADPARFGPAATPAAEGERDAAHPGEHEPGDPAFAATVEQPPKLDNDLYVRDYSKCILCYQCVDACGEQWQNTFAITAAGRGFDARISTEFAVPLTDSGCVYCGNCIEVCPTGALMSRSEFDMRAQGLWDEEAQSQVTTICPYCGVGCNVTLHVQANRIVKVSSPHDNYVTRGNLCVKGRFGFEFVQNRPPPSPPDGETEGGIRKERPVSPP